MIYSPRFTVILDACVLYPAPIRDILLNLADLEIYSPKWSEIIQEEWIRNLLENRPDLSKLKLRRTAQAMNAAFPDAEVHSFEELIDLLELPDSGDRHVLEAGIKCKADVIITFNTKDFPRENLDQYNIEVYTPELVLVLLFIAFLCLKSVLAEVSTHMVLSMTTLETVEQIVEQVKEENTDVSTRGGGKNKPSIKEEIEHAKARLSKNEYKSARSNYKRMVEHVDKLEKYRQNPLKYDNLGLLKNAPNEQIKQKIIQSRIAHLEKEIQTFYNNIVKIIN